MDFLASWWRGSSLWAVALAVGLLLASPRSSCSSSGFFLMLASWHSSVGSSARGSFISRGEPFADILSIRSTLKGSLWSSCCTPRRHARPGSHARG